MRGSVRQLPIRIRGMASLRLRHVLGAVLRPSPTDGRARRPRLLINCISYAPEIIGAAPYSRDIATWFAAHGWDVRVVTAPPHYPQWRIWDGYSPWRYVVEQLDGVTVWRCPTWVPRVPSGGKRLAHYCAFALSTLPVMLGHAFWRPDVTLVVAPTIVSAPGALAAAALSRSLTWLHVQDYELAVALELGMLPGIVAPVLARVEKAILKSFDIVSTITERMLNRASDQGVPRERLLLLPNWASLESVFPLSRPSRFRETLQIGPDSRVVLYSGNMGRKQGIELIARAAELSERAGSSIVHVVAGEGVTCEVFAEDIAACGVANVLCLPLQHGADINELMNLADVHLIVQLEAAADLVMPSKLTNILASGRPVVVTAAPDTALAELVEREDLGVVVPPGNAHELAVALEGLVANTERRTRQGANARVFAERFLNKDQLLAVVLDRLLRGA